jgi:drug/metabolite transporter (DMT)-like permease
MKYKSITLVVLAYLSIAIMSSFVKIATKNLPTTEILFARFAIGLLFLIPIVSRSKNFKIKTANIKYYLLRNIAGLLGMFFMFYSLKHLHVATSVLLINSASLFVPILMLLMFKQKTSYPVLLSTITGFIGVIVIVVPSTIDNTSSTFYLLVGVLSAVMAAFAYIGIKKLSSYDSPLQIIFNFYLMSCILIPIFTIYSWHMPSSYDFLLLIMIGLFGLLFQIFMNYALKYANITTVTPFVFTGVLFAGLIDWIIWNQVPSINFWIGSVIIIISVSALAKAKN